MFGTLTGVLLLLTFAAVFGLLVYTIVTLSFVTYSPPKRAAAAAPHNLRNSKERILRIVKETYERREQSMNIEPPSRPSLEMSPTLDLETLARRMKILQDNNWCESASLFVYCLLVIE